MRHLFILTFHLCTACENHNSKTTENLTLDLAFWFVLYNKMQLQRRSSPIIYQACLQAKSQTTTADSPTSTAPQRLACELLARTKHPQDISGNSILRARVNAKQLPTPIYGFTGTNRSYAYYFINLLSYLNNSQGMAVLSSQCWVRTCAAHEPVLL